MSIDWAALLGVLGPLSICVMLVILGLLSRRLGRVTRARPYYVGLLIAALLVAFSVVLRLAVIFYVMPLDTFLALAMDGLMAVGITLGATVTWRYWSWLLSERG